MRRRWKWVALSLLAALAVFGVYARLFAGGPIGPFPGGALSGEPAASLPGDWGFANQHHDLAVESRAFRLPYSRSVWFMSHEGRLHLLLPSFFGDGLARRVQADPRVRVRPSGRLYDLIAHPVDEAGQRGAILAPLLRRQMGIEISGRIRDVPRPESDDPVGIAVYRLEDPS